MTRRRKCSPRSCSNWVSPRGRTSPPCWTNASRRFATWSPKRSRRFGPSRPRSIRARRAPQPRAQEELDVEAFADDGAPIPRLAATVLYRVAQESLRNAARHAQAHRVELWLRRTATAATIEIVDDGRGFDVRRAEERRPGMGLFSMRERVGLANGSLSVESAPGRGTRIVATVPLTEQVERGRR